MALTRRLSRWAPSVYKHLCKTNTRTPRLASRICLQPKHSEYFLCRCASSAKDTVTVYFVSHTGDKTPAVVDVGDTFLHAVVKNNLKFGIFGACEGTLSCSECHIWLKKDNFDALPDGASYDEQEILRYAFGLSEWSRLGCQIYITKEMDGWEVSVPKHITDPED